MITLLQPQLNHVSITKQPVSKHYPTLTSMIHQPTSTVTKQHHHPRCPPCRLINRFAGLANNGQVVVKLKDSPGESDGNQIVTRWFTEGFSGDQPVHLNRLVHCEFMQTMVKPWLGESIGWWKNVPLLMLKPCSWLQHCWGLVDNMNGWNMFDRPLTTSSLNHVKNWLTTTNHGG